MASARRLPGLLGLVLLGAAGCTITPERIQRIETENELLRQEIRVIKEKCDYYKTLELEVEPEAGAEAE